MKHRIYVCVYVVAYLYSVNSGNSGVQIYFDHFQATLKVFSIWHFAKAQVWVVRGGKPRHTISEAMILLIPG